MKRFLELLQPHLYRPILYSTMQKLMMGLCAVLLWNRYLVAGSMLDGRGLGNGFFAAAFYFSLWTWLQYLTFDGMRPLKDLFPDREQPAPRPGNRLQDLININPDALSELEDDEKTVARLCSNAVAAAVFLIVYFIV